MDGGLHNSVNVLHPTSYTLEKDEDGKFYILYILAQLKKF